MYLRFAGLHFGDIHVLTARYISGLKEVMGYSKYAISLLLKNDLWPMRWPIVILTVTCTGSRETERSVDY